MSPWFAVAHDRSTWWALHHGMVGDADWVNSLRIGRLVGRLWPDAVADGLYLSADLALWTRLVTDAIAQVDFTPDVLSGWSDRLVAAFATASSHNDDPFANALVNIRQRWSLGADEARVPACTAELSRFLSALATEASWRDGEARAAPGEVVSVRTLTSGLPLLLTCVPAEFVPGLGGRDCADARALVRRAGAVSAWVRDLALEDREELRGPETLVEWLAEHEGVSIEVARSRGRVRRHAEAIGFAQAAETARAGGDVDLRWLADVLTQWVAGYEAWVEESRTPVVNRYEQTPFPAAAPEPPA